ncbi:MAG TPA: CaiB/BaiF CoA-transferase family protein [Xanthobacteraceae bacterium]|jgi:crotonobetainyl-CoA:carnitine CoA-transferase CaiB-like acyl-CoA transferase|nr:CaiB/BaiF CoA-transferase family protein [Xanthobacteraceae bacterium]
MKNLPMLKGYRVLDIGQFVAAPTCTRILAEMGAEVIKLELAPFGDRGRFAGDKPRDPELKKSSQSTYYFQHNHSKKSLAVDIKQDRGRELVYALIPKIDVVVENFAPGVMARAGFGYDKLCGINPKLIMCSISLAGQSGPLSDKPGFDYMGAAYAGITSCIGETDRGPAQLPIAISDSSTGVTAAMAVGFALLHRERTGEGQYIDCSLLDTYFNMHEVNVPKSSLRGAQFHPPRMGSLHPDGGPTGVFRCRDDQFVAIMVLPHQWPLLVKAMNMPELAEDVRFRDARGRRDNNEALKDVIESWLKNFVNRDQAIAALEAERVPCAPVLSLHEAMAHPHLRERGTVRRVTDLDIGAFDIPGLAAKFSHWPPATEIKADRLGEHNEEILHDVLGLSEAEIRQLYRDRTIVHDPLLERQMRGADSERAAAVK